MVKVVCDSSYSDRYDKVASDTGPGTLLSQPQLSRSDDDTGITIRPKKYKRASLAFIISKELFPLQREVHEIITDGKKPSDEITGIEHFTSELQEVSKESFTIAYTLHKLGSEIPKISEIRDNIDLFEYFCKGFSTIVGSRINDVLNPKTSNYKEFIDKLGLNENELKTILEKSVLGECVYGSNRVGGCEFCNSVYDCH